MNTQTKLQVCAGIAAVIALPLMYVGLGTGDVLMPWTGLALFGGAMMVTPLLRILPVQTSGDYDDV